MPRRSPRLLFCISRGNYQQLVAPVREGRNHGFEATASASASHFELKERQPIDVARILDLISVFPRAFQRNVVRPEAPAVGTVPRLVLPAPCEWSECKLYGT